MLKAATIAGGALASTTLAASATAATALTSERGRDEDQARSLHRFLFSAGGPFGSLWLSRARENATLIAPDRVRRSAIWAWLGWWVPVVGLWFPKQIVDDSWQITSSVAAVGPRGRYETPAFGGCCGLHTTWPERVRE
jgi:hypothetical protein